MKQQTPTLTDETYALIRRYLFGNLSTEEWNKLEDLLKDINPALLASIITQLKSCPSTLGESIDPTYGRMTDSRGMTKNKSFFRKDDKKRG